jgi:DNA-binding MarR family transcriptional regulator
VKRFNRGSNRLSSRESLAAEIGREFSEWQTAVQRFDDLAAAKLGLNVTDLRILGFLATRGPLAAGQLAEAAGLSPGAGTAAIDRLERSGHVVRSRPGEDRRRVLVTLTPRARTQIEEIWGPLAQAGMTRLRRFTVEQLTLLRDFTRWGLELQLKEIARLKESDT